MNLHIVQWRSECCGIITFFNFNYKNCILQIFFNYLGNVDQFDCSRNDQHQIIFSRKTKNNQPSTIMISKNMMKIFRSRILFKMWCNFYEIFIGFTRKLIFHLLPRKFLSFSTIHFVPNRECVTSATLLCISDIAFWNC